MPDDRLAELLESPIPEKLWHYTSIAGFQGIITSGEIFATDIRFVNDRQEFIYARTIAEGVIANQPEEDEDGVPIKGLLAKTFDGAFATHLSPQTMQVFVASFTEAEDQLSQWRAYSQGTSGVSLAFDLRTLRPPTGTGTLVCFAPCVYTPSQQKQLVLSAFDPLRDEVEGYWRSTFERACTQTGKKPTSNRGAFVKEFLERNPEVRRPKEDLRMPIAHTVARLLQAACLMKHPAFGEEREWRLILPVEANKVSGMKNPPRFRSGKTTLIPFVAHPLTSARPIVDIILGPGSDPNAGSAAQELLKLRSLDAAPRYSQVPFRTSTEI